MTIFPHTIVGAVVGSISPNVIVAIFGGAASHIVLDFIPHWEPKLTKGKFSDKPLIKRVVILSLVAVDIWLSIVLLWLMRDYPLMVVGGVCGAALDIDNFLQFKFKEFPLLSRIGIRVHNEGSKWHGKASFIPGMTTQLSVAIAGLLAIYLQLFQK